MKVVNKIILLISPEPWNHIFVSKHHYASHLAKRGNKVFFLNPPLDQVSCIETEYSNLFSVEYKGFIKGLRFLPSFLQKRIIRKKFEELQLLCEIKFEIVWSFDNSVFSDFSALPKSIYSVSHIVDLNQDFEFKRATNTANLCLSTSEYIADKQRRYNLNSHNIGHGFNKLERSLEPFKLNGENKINCGYAGNLDIEYLDWALIEKLLIDFSIVDFHFAGQWKMIDRFTQITKNANFHYYGKLPANKLPSFYEAMDLLMIGYKYADYPEQLANPHKMMEYLASGKMVIATWTEEYEELHKSELLCMSKSSGEFIRMFKEIVSNLDDWNSNDKINTRKEFALNNTYDKQIERIEKLMEVD